jgi:thiol:disulfide interchange protein DsbC
MQRFTFRLTWLLLAATLAFLAAMSVSAAPKAADPANAMSKDALAVKQAFEAKFAGAVVSNVSKSPYFGLYELQLDDKLLYTDAQVTYVVVGAIYDASTKTNVTEARLRKLNRVDWDTLPLDLAIKKVKGDGSRKLAIFSDADCPYCKQLEREMKNLTNVTTYTFLFPIDQLHPDSARKSAAIWCSPDRVKAWDDWFENGKLPENAGDCATPIAETAELGRKYRMNATPTLVFADGSVVPGALPLDRLEGELKQAEAEAKKMAASKH